MIDGNLLRHILIKTCVALARCSFVIVLLFAIGLKSAYADRIKIVAGNTMIADIISDLMPDAHVMPLIQGIACPGHEAVSAGDLKFLSLAKIAIIASWQREHFKKIFEVAEIPEQNIFFIDNNSSWLIPAVQDSVSKGIADLLQKSFPEQSYKIYTKLESRKREIAEIATKCAIFAKQIKGIPIICATMQTDFAKFLNFDIVAELPNSDDGASIRKLTDVASKGKSHNAMVVIVNLQSGIATGIALSQELKIPCLILSNFPKDSSQSYVDLMRDNLNALQPMLNGMVK